MFDLSTRGAGVRAQCHVFCYSRTGACSGRSGTGRIPRVQRQDRLHLQGLRDRHDFGLLREPRRHGGHGLVNGLAEDPAWLSSGARLAFAFDGDIATMNHDGTGVGVATTPDVEFEPTAPQRAPARLHRGRRRSAADLQDRLRRHGPHSADQRGIGLRRPDVVARREQDRLPVAESSSR